MFAEILARFAAQHVCNLKEVKTPQSTLCSDLDDPYLAATPGETIWSARTHPIRRGRPFHPGCGPPPCYAPSRPPRSSRTRCSSSRTGETGRACRHGCIVTLTKYSPGDCEGMTPDEVAVAHPQATTLRKMDKIGYRYPRGESYFDLISRIEPCIQEMESYTEPLLIVSQTRRSFGAYSRTSRASTGSPRPEWRRRYSRTWCTRSTWTRAARGRSGRSQPPARVRHGARF